MISEMTRHYVSVNGLRIHYRKAGRGRPVILFHQSPRSSAEYEDLIQEWSREFLLIAPDTPGCGYSDPLPLEDPDMMDFAKVMADFVRALDLGKVGLYGFHTGASLACCVAGLLPERIAMAVAHGLAKFRPDERADLLARYLPPFRPQWDGGHLAWLWARFREQATFFPWYRRENETRLRMSMYDADKMAAQVNDFLLSGDEYRKAYAAAFSFNPDAVLGDMKAPIKILGAPPDPLFIHLDRLEGYSDCCELIAYESPQQAREGTFELLKQAEYGDPTPKTALAEGPESSGKGFVYSGGVRLHYRKSGEDRRQPPVVLLHDLTENTAAREEIVNALGKTRTVIALDLPGHGGSAPLPTDDRRPVETCADLLLGAISSLTGEAVELLTYGISAMIGHRMRCCSERILKHTALGFLVPAADMLEDFGKSFLPDLSRNPWGGHLMSAWYCVRNRHLFWPWYQQQAENIIPITSDFQASKLHNFFVALWQVEEKTAQCLFEDILNRLRTDGVPAFEGENMAWLPGWAKDSKLVHLPDGQVKFYGAGSEPLIPEA
ncbi:alpha/beta fold hydrolase [Luteithermobacter gelatinilyticus]|uniref:alpha/beta fold hydrolase n=1 Tax=Luteithermobacter gelatinilyticus TaxID=2582913 RepID=UPI00143CDD89|nr:alpha/beta hydrolase [Luteithermobacter gelatinilyticus]